jgi:hypothetical protein
MKPKRLNLIVEVRAALIGEGYSTVRVVNAVNAALNDLKEDEKHPATQRTGDGKIVSRGKEYAVGVNIRINYRGKSDSPPLLFDAWHSAIAKCQTIAEFPVTIPPIFAPWLEKMKATKEEATKEGESLQLEKAHND